MATKLEKEYLTRVAELGCICCLNNGFEDTPAEIHHIRAGKGVADRAPYWETLPLCPIHHRQGDGTKKTGGELGFHSAAAISTEVHLVGGLGDIGNAKEVEVPVEGKKWEDRYGTERDLLSQVHGMLPTELLNRVAVDKAEYNERLQRLEDGGANDDSTERN